ncbi:MAG: hypothetical protein AAFV53_15055 [Myxococcota bacterium]
MKTNARRSAFSWVQELETAEVIHWDEPRKASAEEDRKEHVIGAAGKARPRPAQPKKNPVILPATVALVYILFLSGVQVLKHMMI